MTPLKARVLRAIRRYGRVTTPELVRVLAPGDRNGRRKVWRRLLLLARCGVVRRTLRTRGRRVAVWELAAGSNP